LENDFGKNRENELDTDADTDRAENDKKKKKNEDEGNEEKQEEDQDWLLDPNQFKLIWDQVDIKFVDALEIAKPDAKRKRPDQEKQKRGKETGLDKDGETLSGQLRRSESSTGHMFPGGKGHGADPTEGKLTHSTFPEDGNVYLLTYTDRIAPSRFSDPITPDELRHSSKGYYSAISCSSSSSTVPGKATKAEFVSWKNQLIKRWVKQGQATLDVRKLNRAEISIDSEWFEKTRACDCDWKTLVSKLKAKELIMLETPLISTSP
jgi:hypothetical protein